MERKFFVDAAQAGDEVVLKGADRSLGGVASMHVWWDELVVDVLVGEELFENTGAFVVEAL